MTVKCYKAFNKYTGLSYNTVCARYEKLREYYNVDTKVSENGQRIGFCVNGRLAGMYDERNLCYYEYKG